MRLRYGYFSWRKKSKCDWNFFFCQCQIPKSNFNLKKTQVRNHPDFLFFMSFTYWSLNWLRLWYGDFNWRKKSKCDWNFFFFQCQIPKSNFNLKKTQVRQHPDVLFFMSFTYWVLNWLRLRYGDFSFRKKSECDWNLFFFQCQIPTSNFNPRKRRPERFLIYFFSWAALTEVLIDWDFGTVILVGEKNQCVIEISSFFNANPKIKF